jgi:hypothetical protein
MRLGLHIRTAVALDAKILHRLQRPRGCGHGGRTSTLLVVTVAQKAHRSFD